MPSNKAQYGPCIIGIDPGYDRMGVAVIGGKRDKPTLIYSTCIETEKGDSFSKRLKYACDVLRKVIALYQPESMAIEEVYFSKNQKTALQVAQVRGALLLIAEDSHLPTREYNPSAIKIAVTGHGRAEKSDVLFMLQKLIDIPHGTGKKLDDEYDAIAIGITHLASISTTL